MNEINLNENSPSINNLQKEIVVTGSSKSKTKYLIIGIILLLSILVLGTTYYLKKVKVTDQKSIKNEETKKQEKLFSGTLKRIDNNLMIFKNTEDDTLNKMGNNFVCYEAGVFQRGELQGYTRIIAIRPPETPKGPIIYTLATKDFQKYYIDDPKNEWSNKNDSDYEDAFYYIDKSKIIGAKIFEREDSEEISLDNNFALFRENYSTDNIKTERIDNNGNNIYETILKTDLSNYQKLESPFSNLEFYFEKFSTNESNVDASEKQKNIWRQKYILGSSEVMVVDSSGLPTSYTLSTVKNIEQYKKDSSEYEIKLKKYNEAVTKYENKEISEYPVHPDFVYLPNLGFKSTQLEANKMTSYFSDYRSAFPSACSNSMNTKVANVNESELEEVAKIDGNSVYRLKDKNSEMYSLAYENKFNYYESGDPSEWESENKGINKSNLKEYINKNPLLFIKDYWQRWIVLGEYDINLPGGCGKPVIYLYPEKETEVRVELKSPVKFSTQIPLYKGFWQVLANSEGKLVDLKKEDKDCQLINNKLGSEYAKKACQENVYPYLYWSGNVVSIDYPKVNDGWIIKKEDVSSFLEKTLSDIGFNSQEKKDFTSYWVPEILAKDSPYYRISFLQTEDLNKLFPMEVEPKPDTIYRLFLDYSPLSNKPEVDLQTPELNKLIRKGFTLVEWGGLKK